MCGKSHFLSVSASSGDKFSLHLAEPVICHNGLSAAGESWRVQPQKTGEIVSLGWMVVVVVVLVVGLILNQ